MRVFTGEMTKKHEQPLDQYWQQPDNEAARQQLLQYLQEQESELKNGLAEDYRQQLEQPSQVLSDARSQQVLDRLHAAIGAKPKRNVILHIARWSAAAAIVLFAGIKGYQYFQQAPAPAVADATAKTEVKEDLVLRRNDSRQPMQVVLSDSSRITLLPGASVRYYEPFRNGRRDVSLAGNARFKVKASVQHPFTVYANEVATTALGTEFSVNTTAPGSHVQVQLFSGKVKVVARDLKKEVLLQPGQQFNIDTVQHQFAVTTFRTAPIRQENAPVHLSSNDRLAFDQQPLTAVLQQISRRYNVHFIYEQKAIGRVQVTGEFLPDDSLDFILSVLSAANNLQFSQQGDTITVRRLK